MTTEIPLKGYTAVPSDYNAPDGDLAHSLNLINEDGALRPIFPPISVFKTNGDNLPGEILYIHKTSAFLHYIAYSQSELIWFQKTDEDDVSAPQPLLTIKKDDIRQIAAVGNTLVILAPEGVYHFLWKEDNKNYHPLGTHLPECPISFGLLGEFTGSDVFGVDFEPINYEAGFTDTLSDSNQTLISNSVLAQVNKFIAEKSTKAGKFIFPFFVRYAYRLYDGSITMQSSPILMMASSDITPEAAVLRIGEPKDGKISNCQVCLYAVMQTLDYAVTDQTYIDQLKNWSDIISSVDIFISKPIYTYDQNGKCTGFERTNNSDSYGIYKLINQQAPVSTYPMQYQKHAVHEAYALRLNNFSDIYRYRVALPKKSQDQIKDEIKQNSIFYLLEKIDIKDLKTQRTAINVNEDYLQSLITRETMTDDYDSHDTLIPKYATVYNSRINYANIRKRLYDSYSSGALMQHTDGYVTVLKNINPNVVNRKNRYAIYFHIKQDGKDLTVLGESADFACDSYHPITFLFYPNINAYKATIVVYDYYIGIANSVYELPLEKHSMLNGAFYFNGWQNPERLKNPPIYSTPKPAYVDLHNKIYTSEVNNPFIFPVTGINTVGTGNILGVSTAARALSQGQFGQFPLYAFTDEGVWAMEVSASGTYSAKQPITRDVCINPKGITQIDSSVLFPTDRGIMLISGSQTQCISDTINSETPFDIMSLPGMDKLHAMLSHTDTESHPDKCLSISPFNKFLTGCGMLYDYVHQRIIVYNKDFTYAYVFSLKSKAWGMMDSTIKSSINSYPEALAVDHDGALLNFSDMGGEKTKGEETKELLVTRPLKLETPDVLKTIDTVIQRGHFQKGHVQSVLYGSRDLYNWQLIWSSKDHYLRGFRGTPYKYFRIALLCNLQSDESLFGASLQFTPRQTNQPR